MLCKICKSKEISKIFDAQNTHGRHMVDPNSRFTVFRCQDCQAVFLGDAIINEEYYSKYYPENYYDSGSEGVFLNLVMSLFVRMILSFKESEILRCARPQNPDKLKILDIGCGSGDFLAHISQDKFDKYGLEVNPQGYEKCSKKNLKVFNKELKDCDFEAGYFDVITMWHVLEHLDKPGEFLTHTRKILKDDGLFVIATPNTNSLGFRCGQRNWFHLDSPRHLILYNRISLGFLLENEGFKVRNFKNISYDFPLDLFWSIRRSRWKYLIYPLYPIFKFFSADTVMAIVGKK